MARTHLAPVATLFLFAGCSALGLADGLEQSPCMACSELNAIEPTGDPCLSWQCSNIDDPMAGVCVVGTLDEDEDGSPSSMCVMDGTEDCDDDDPDNRTGVDEVCDLADSDCDGKIDEGALTLDRSDLTSAASLDALSWGEGDMEVVAIYNQGGDLEAAHLPLGGASGGSDTLVGMETNPDPVTTAVARTGSDWAIAYAPRAGCSRIVLGTWSGTGTSLTMPSGHDVSGLPKPGGECPTVDTSAVGHPSLASAVARQVLVAYLADDGARSCGGGAADVGLVVVQRATGGTFGDAGATASDVLGQSVDGAPALVAIDGTYGYLLAFARDDGTIGVHRVQVDGTTRATTVTPDVYVETCGGACGDVSLRAVAIDAGYEVALTYRDGDCTEAAAALRVLSLDPTGETISPIGDRHVSSSATGLRRPVAARRTGPDEWLVSYSYDAGLQRAVAMQRWSDGVSVGDARDMLTTRGVFSQPIAATGGAGAAGYRVFAYDSDVDMLARASAQCTTPAP